MTHFAPANPAGTAVPGISVNPNSSAVRAKTHATQRSELARRAQGTAFEVLYVSTQEPAPSGPLTSKEKNRIQTLARYHKKSAAQRTKDLIAFQPGSEHNFTDNKVPSKTIHYGKGVMGSAA